MYQLTGTEECAEVFPLSIQTPSHIELEETWIIYKFLNLRDSFPLSLKLDYSVPQAPNILCNENLKHQEKF